MEIKEAIMNLLEEKSSATKENFEKAIAKKAAAKLEEMKIEVATNFFGKR